MFALWCSVRFSFLSNCESWDEVILDGIDEASDVKGVLQSYIMRRLVPMENLFGPDLASRGRER